MRRPLVAGVGVVLALAVMPLTARAAGSPAITLRSPAVDDIVVGVMSITWTYQGFSPAAWVDVEASRDGEAFERIARVRIDDGTPGRNGSTTWSTTPDDDSANYEVRVVVPSNKQISSSVLPVVVDNTAPEATEASRTAANDAGWNNDDVTVTWACTDAASGPVEPEVVATVVDEGTDLTASATCTDRAGHSVTATAEGIDIDRTAPTANITTLSATGTPATALLVNITGSALDGLSGTAGVVVSFVNAAGITTERTAFCACGASLASWSVATQGLAPGVYRVTALATDAAGNTGASATAEYVIVAAPELPPVTAPTVTPPTVTQPEPTVPDVTTLSAPPVTVPEVSVPTTLPSL